MGTIEQKVDAKKQPTQVRCCATIPEASICNKLFDREKAEYIGGYPYCPECYERWFYQQD